MTIDLPERGVAASFGTRTHAVDTFEIGIPEPLKPLALST